MITEQKIRDRLVACLDEVHKTESKAEIARTIGCSAYYLSYLPNVPNPQIPAALIANFCIKYTYSVTYILTGKGDTRADQKTMTKEEKWQVERENLHELIARLIKAGVDRDPVKKLAKEVLKQKS